ncbi:MAG: DUF128 domain-containing protein, partial [Dehalococcoidia bacterium]
MMQGDSSDVERKTLAILKVLSEVSEPLGSITIARELERQGVFLSERAVRYHLRITDERGLTQLFGRRDGRVLTEQGSKELGNALVKDKVGFAISRIELLAFRTNFDLQNRTGSIPVNVSLFAKEQFSKAVQTMKPVFASGLCVSHLVATAQEGEKLGELTVPEGKVGLATVCSIVVNGTLLKAGVPIDSKFGGLLQIHNGQPLRFVELIHYAGSSLDPSEVFIKAGMTSVTEVATKGEGTLLANFREIPALCRPIAEEVATKLREAGMEGILI